MYLKAQPEKSPDVEETLWDDDSIQSVIRAAARRGVCPSVVFAETESHKEFLNHAPTVRIGD